MDRLGKLAREHGFEAAQPLLAAVVKAGGSWHVVAAAAAALWRLAMHPGQAAENRGEEAAGSAHCFRLLEEALEAVRLLAGGGGRPDVTEAKAVRRRYGRAGCRLASRWAE